MATISIWRWCLQFAAGAVVFYVCTLLLAGVHIAHFLVEKLRELLGVSQFSDLRGEVIVVTGGRGGFGAALCSKLSHAGATVFSLDIAPIPAPAAAAASTTTSTSSLPTSSSSLPRTMGRVVELAVDITDAAAVRAFIEDHIRPLEHPIFALVNNAGIFGKPCAALECTDANLRHVMDINFFAPLALTRELYPFMRQGRRRRCCTKPGCIDETAENSNSSAAAAASGKETHSWGTALLSLLRRRLAGEAEGCRPTCGRVVNVTSCAGLVTMGGMAPYSSSKFALEALSDCLRIEMRGALDVVVVEPHFADTGIIASFLAADDTEIGESLLSGQFSSSKRRFTRLRSTPGGLLSAAFVARSLFVALAERTPRDRYMVCPDIVTDAQMRLLAHAPNYFHWVDRVKRRHATTAK